MATETKAAATACEDIERIRRVAALIKNSWSLCDFMGKAEKETMVASTIRACVHNYEEHGEVFSNRGKNLDEDYGGGLVENRSSYTSLLTDGYLVEVKRDGKTVIKPTVKLLERLEKFFKL